MESVLCQAEKRFLSGYSLKKWCLKDMLAFIMVNGDDALLFQKALLKRTVQHRLMEKFPLKLSYRTMFLKMLISEMEESNIEVCDEIYEAYCHLLGGSESHQLCGLDKHYRHFVLGNKYVSLLESTSIVSEGTTGLHAWQPFSKPWIMLMFPLSSISQALRATEASMALAEWCLKHQERLLEGKKILELGSGVGLTGLACLLRTVSQPFSDQGLESEIQSQRPVADGGTNPQLPVKSSLSPSIFTFSDCHPSVLRLLCGNVRLNLMDSSSELGQTDSADGHALLETCYGETKVRVINLLWQNVEAGTKEAMEMIGQVDIVIAADVVYDQSLFKPLIGALKRLITNNNNSASLPVILACTKRNSATLKEFMDCLTTSGLIAREEKPLQPQYFEYDPDPPVGIYYLSMQ